MESESRIQYLTFPAGLNEICGNVCVRGVEEWVKGAKEGAEFLHEEVEGRGSGIVDCSGAAESAKEDDAVPQDLDMIESAKEVEVIDLQDVEMVESSKEVEVAALTDKEAALIEVEADAEKEETVIESVKVDDMVDLKEDEVIAVKEVEVIESATKEDDIVDSEDVEMKEASPIEMDMEQEEDDELNAEPSQHINVRKDSPKKRKSRASSSKPESS
jgi:hypothetical protein